MTDPSPSDRTEAYRRASERVRARLGFAGHAAVWAAVGILLLIVNLIATPDFIWFFWPVVFWLVALALHGWTVFGPGMPVIERWRQREAARELERMRRRDDQSGDA